MTHFVVLELHFKIRLQTVAFLAACRFVWKCLGVLSVNKMNSGIKSVRHPLS